MPTIINVQTCIIIYLSRAKHQLIKISKKRLFKLYQHNRLQIRKKQNFTFGIILCIKFLLISLKYNQYYLVSIWRLKINNFTIKVQHHNNCQEINTKMDARIGPPFEKQIDQLLKLQFHQLCFNPSKRDAFIRLTSDPAQISEMQEVREGPLSTDNRLLNHYIRQVYEKYGIEDPISKEMRLAAKYHNIVTPEKIVNNSNTADSDLLTRTKKKLLNLKDSFKRDSDEVIYSSEFSNQQTYQEGPSTINASKMNKQIGYRTKQKIRFKTVTNDDEIYHNSPLVLREFTLADNRSRQTSNRNSYNHLKGNNKQGYKQLLSAFRYCPMCEDMVQQQNSAIHQSKCKQLQLALAMPIDDFERLIINKIKRMEGAIYHQVFQKRQQSIADEFASIKQSIKLWMDKSEKSSFGQIKQKFQRFSLNLFEQISKLNWFRSFHRRFQGDRNGKRS